MAGASISFILFFLQLLSSASVLVTSQNSTIENKCSQEFPKVTSCLEYATAKAAAPSSSCCSAVGDIRNTDAVCLCFIIQQTHTESPTVKSLGLQFDRLLHLSDACKLANTRVSDCPKLLKLSPGSPDYAIFTNATTKATSSSTGAAAVADASSGFCRQKIYLVSTTAITLLSAVLLSIFSVEYSFY